MAAIIDINDAKAWADSKKINIDVIEDDLASQIAAQVLGVASNKYNTETWTTPLTTPILIRRIISMKYVGTIYHRSFSTDTGPGEYGTLLLRDAEILLNSISDGTLTFDDPLVVASVVGTVSFEPIDDPKFTMDQTW